MILKTLFFFKARSNCHHPARMLVLSMLAFVCLQFVSPSSYALESVNLQLRWKHQFQFAGYYAAKAKGYYREHGLNVNFIEAKPGKRIIDEVLSGKAQYGIDVSALLLERAAGKPVVALCVIFQHSPVVLITGQKSPTQSLHSLIGKRVMIDKNSDEISAYLKKEGLTPDQLILVKHNFNVRDLMDGKVDAMSAYVTNELFFLSKAGFRYSAYTPRSDGIDFYGDTLFTTEQELKSHPARAKAFREASLKGWKYAMSHPEEIADLILAEYSHQKSREHLLFEAQQMATLIQPDLVELGYMNPGRWRHIADTYADLGMLPRNFPLDDFVFDPDPRHDHTRIMIVAVILAANLAIALGFVFLLRKMVRLKTIQLENVNQELTRQSNQMGSIINGTNDAIFIKDTSGNYIIINNEIERLFGKTRAQILGRNDTWLLPPEESGFLMDHDRKVMGGGKVVTIEEQITTMNGKRTFLATKGPIHDESGSVTGLFCISRDITERKLEAEERNRLEMQLLQSQKMESVGRLAGGIAHDFNNILTVILGQAQLGQLKTEPTHPLYSRFKEIADAAKRAADLIRQLLAFARKQTVTPKVLDLNETVQGMLGMLHRLIGEHIRLDWQPAPHVWSINIDPSQIDQLLANLCVNARDSIADVGKIVIKTENCAFDQQFCSGNKGFIPGEYVQLSIRDSGCGMDKETLEHIFEPFYTTKDIGKGTGLGLATVYGIVKQNTGFINVDSKPGQGSVFTIYLPRFTGAMQRPDSESPVAPLECGEETILLVEDESSILHTATQMLEEQGYTVLAVPNPAKAIGLARKHPGRIHMLITDVIMPEMNGRELGTTVQALFPDIRILFMSGYSAQVVAPHGVLDEGLHFIQKPFTLSSLISKVREVMEN